MVCFKTSSFISLLSSSTLVSQYQYEFCGISIYPPILRCSVYMLSTLLKCRNCKSPDVAVDKNGMVDSGRSKCLPRTIKLSSCKQSKNEIMRSPLSDGPRISSEGQGYASQSTSKGSSKRFIDASSAKGSSFSLR